MKNLVIGILAHVDAGKTTLSEGMLYESGSIGKMGRVDNRDAFLDTYELERARGITIFSKQALIRLKDIRISLLDTPGHVDFSPEMERTLQVMDYAILVISGSNGVQAHTQTLWHLLKKYKIPVFIFVNKMDQEGTDKERLLGELRKRLEEGCVDFNSQGTENFYENIAMSNEDVLDSFLETAVITTEQIRTLIQNRKVFPCFFGSALKLTGVKELLEGIEKYAVTPQYPTAAFGARIFKITRDKQENRLTYLKVTGGVLRTKMMLGEGETQEKVNQIRVYSGEKYETPGEVEAGMICAIAGPVHTYPGEGLGLETKENLPLLIPVLWYRLRLPDNCNPGEILPKLRQLEEEEPALHLIWKEELREIQCQIMGEVQIEILKSILWERFGIEAEFDEGNIVYRETIKDSVIGVGHFEPLRHYAEVQLLLEPGEAGSGLSFSQKCSVDVLDKNWQRLILTHLKEKEHKGVLTGSFVTDIKITLLAGRAHPKHTEGGDFREATYRAVRQGLRQADSVLLEPFYEFYLEVPEKMVGRAMTDLKAMYGNFEVSECVQGITVLKGTAPVATMRNYQREFLSYTKGEGKLFLQVRGYQPCHNEEEVMKTMEYDPEKDMDNPTGSVFCSHGSGFLVPWDQVKEYQHIENKKNREEKNEPSFSTAPSLGREQEEGIGEEEVTQIISRTFYANSQEKVNENRKYSYKTQEKLVLSSTEIRKKKEAGEEYLLVDGYNIIFAWEDLKELAKENMDGARGKLMDILCNYQALKGCQLIVVFDAYRVEGHQTEILEYHNIHVVFTKEAETADQYIERFAYQNGKKYEVTVATSDGLEQIIIRSQGCHILSAGDFAEEVFRICEKLREDYLDKQPKGRSYLLDALSGAERKQWEDRKT
ncbi:MAG: TetM/TetW/TetO/TetS family tetracycline resistance ribosomal protection protein [Acetivibrio sp.]